MQREATREARPLSQPEAQPAPQPPSKRSTRRRIVEDLVLVVFAVVVAVLVRTFVAQAYFIPSPSMVPELKVNDRVVVSRLAYHLHPIHRGDIVVFKAPPGVGSTYHAGNPIVAFAHDLGDGLGVTEDQTVLIKRVIGLPGDTVEARGGHVYVDGDLLVEPYLPKGTTTSDFGPVTVPPGHLWLMGDNRGDSEDSRYFGPVPESSVIGRAIWRVWPPWRLAFL